MLGFMKTLPKTKDLLAVADLADFLATISSNPKTADLLKQIAAEKAETEKMLSSAQALSDQAGITMAQALAEKADNAAQLEDIKNQRIVLAASKDAEVKRLESIAMSIYQREIAVEQGEDDLRNGRAAYQRDRDSLDAVLADKDAWAQGEVQKARDAQAAADAMKAKYEDKLAAISRAAGA